MTDRTYTIHLDALQLPDGMIQSVINEQNTLNHQFCDLQ